MRQASRPCATQPCVATKKRLCVDREEQFD
jgi:hypothetical protein